MHVSTRSLLEAVLMFATKLPGRKALLLLPAVALYGRTDPEFLRAKADSAAADASMASSTTSSGSVYTTASGDHEASGLTAMLSKLMGSNEFASVSPSTCCNDKGYISAILVSIPCVQHQQPRASIYLRYNQG